MADKTIDELKAELDALKKANLERELAEEKKKAEDAEKLKKQKEDEDLRQSIREEVLTELAEKSKITEVRETHPAEDLGNNMFLGKENDKATFEVFANNVRRNMAKEAGISYDAFDASGYPGNNAYEKRIAWVVAGGKKRIRGA